MPRLAIIISAFGNIESLEATLVSVLENRPSDSEIVVALKRPAEEDFVYAPGGDSVLTPGTTLIVIGPLDRVHMLEGLASADGKPQPVPMT